MSELHVLPHRAPDRGGADLLEADLQAMLERAVAQLAVIESRFESSRAAIEASAYPRPWKDWRLAQLELRRQRDRAPLAQLVGHVHQRLDSARFLHHIVAATDVAGDPVSAAVH